MGDWFTRTLETRKLNLGSGPLDSAILGSVVNQGNTAPGFHQKLDNSPL